MPTTHVEDRIRNLVDQLVSDLTRHIRTAALQAVQEAISGMETAPRGTRPV